MKRVVVEFHFGSATSTKWFVCPEQVQLESEVYEKCVNAERFVKEWLDRSPKTHRRAVVEVPDNAILTKVRHTSRGNIRIENFEVSKLSDMTVLSYV